MKISKETSGNEDNLNVRIAIYVMETELTLGDKHVIQHIDDTL